MTVGLARWAFHHHQPPPAAATASAMAAITRPAGLPERAGGAIGAATGAAIAIRGGSLATSGFAGVDALAGAGAGGATNSTFTFGPPRPSSSTAPDARISWVSLRPLRKVPSLLASLVHQLPCLNSNVTCRA